MWKEIEKKGTPSLSLSLAYNYSKSKRKEMGLLFSKLYLRDNTSFLKPTSKYKKSTFHSYDQSTVRLGRQTQKAFSQQLVRKGGRERGFTGSMLYLQ